METFGYIYKITNKQNNLSYVGKKQGRFDETYWGSGELIKPLTKKLGTDNFTRVIIAHAFNEGDLFKQEKFWIKETNCIWPNGYNLTEGGIGGDTSKAHNKEKCKCCFCKGRRGEYKGKKSPRYKVVVSNKTRMRMSKKKQEAVKRPEVIENLRNAQLGKKYSNQVNKKKGRPGKLNHRFGKNYYWIFNIQTKQTKLIKPNSLSGHLNNGWIQGRINREVKNVTT